MKLDRMKSKIIVSIGVISIVPPIGGTIFRIGSMIGSVIKSSIRAISLPLSWGTHDKRALPKIQNPRISSI